LAKPRLKGDDLVKALIAGGIGAGAGTLGEWALRGRVSGAGTLLGAAAGLGYQAWDDPKMVDRFKNTLSQGFGKQPPTSAASPKPPPTPQPPPTPGQPPTPQQPQVAAPPTPIDPRTGKPQRRVKRGDIIQKQDEAQYQADVKQLQQEDAPLYENLKFETMKPEDVQEVSGALRDIMKVAPYEAKGTVGSGATVSLPPELRRQLLTDYAVVHKYKTGKIPTPQDIQRAERSIFSMVGSGEISPMHPNRITNAMADIVEGKEGTHGWKDYGTYTTTPEGIPISGSAGGPVEKVSNLWSQMTSDPENRAGIIAGQLGLPVNLAARFGPTAMRPGAEKLAGKLLIPIEIADNIVESYQMLATDPKTGEKTIELEDFANLVTQGDRGRQGDKMLNAAVSNLEQKAPVELQNARQMAEAIPEAAAMLEDDFKKYQAGEMTDDEWNQKRNDALKVMGLGTLGTTMQVYNPARIGLSYGHALATKGSPLEQRVQLNDFYKAVAALKSKRDVGRAHHLLTHHAKRMVGAEGKNFDEMSGYERDAVYAEYKDLMARAKLEAEALKPSEIGDILRQTSKRGGATGFVRNFSEGVPVFGNVLRGGVESVNTLGELTAGNKWAESMSADTSLGERIQEIVRAARLRNQAEKARQAASNQSWYDEMNAMTPK